MLVSVHRNNLYQSKNHVSLAVMIIFGPKKKKIQKVHLTLDQITKKKTLQYALSNAIPFKYLSPIQNERVDDYNYYITKKMSLLGLCIR